MIMYMKRIYAFAAVMLLALPLSAQSDRFFQRYNLLVSQLGPAGVGVETLLENWEKVDSSDRRMLVAKHEFYLTKSRSEQVVKKSSDKYLGMKPVLTLKDSLGNNVYYYQEAFYDDQLYGNALKAADRLIALYPDELDYRVLKAGDLVLYEKESPDMALSFLMDLIDEDAARTRPWNYDGQKQDDDFLKDVIQEYCREFYMIGSPQAMKAFLSLSRKMYKLYPDKICFLSNIGTWHLVAENDPKSALKCYSKVLKKSKDDETAIRNSIVAARRIGNVKLEKKYRQMLQNITEEN